MHLRAIGAVAAVVALGATIGAAQANDDDTYPNWRGMWVDANGGGKYDVLEVETRGFKGPRIVDASGIPLHADNQTVIKERIRLDPADPNILQDEITTIDNALTKPWTVTRKYKRQPN